MTAGLQLVSIAFLVPLMTLVHAEKDARKSRCETPPTRTCPLLEPTGCVALSPRTYRTHPNAACDVTRATRQHCSHRPSPTTSSSPTVLRRGGHHPRRPTGARRRRSRAAPTCESSCQHGTSHPAERRSLRTLRLRARTAPRTADCDVASVDERCTCLDEPATPPLTTQAFTSSYRLPRQDRRERSRLRAES